MLKLNLGSIPSSAMPPESVLFSPRNIIDTLEREPTSRISSIAEANLIRTDKQLVRGDYTKPLDLIRSMVSNPMKGCEVLGVCESTIGISTIYNEDLNPLLQNSSDPYVSSIAPFCCEIAEDGTLVILDRSNCRISYITKEGHFIRATALLGLDKPNSIALRSDGSLCASDNKKVILYSRSGEKISEINDLQNPTKICIDHEDNLYVIDKKSSSSSEIRKYDVSGNYIGSFENEIFCIDEMVIDPVRNKIYVPAFENSEHFSKLIVACFDLDGKTLDPLSCTQKNDGVQERKPLRFSTISGIALDGKGNIILSNGPLATISVFTPEGDHIRHSQFDNAAPYHRPYKLAVGRTGEIITTSDYPYSSMLSFK